MKRNLHVLASAVLLSTAGYSMAATVNIGGLSVETGPIFSVTSIYENFVDSVGDELSGVGEVTQINGVNLSDLCAGCELTYQFGGYMVTGISATDISFSGGWVNFYLGFGADNDFNPFASANSAADIAAAINGTPFLNLAGHAVDAAGNTFKGTGTNLNSTAAVGFGAGLADVTEGAGIANAYFDSNSISATFGGPADFQIGSSFGNAVVPHANECPSGPLCLAGSADFRAQVIPEPETYALMLAGLGVMGFVARRRKQR